MKSVSDYRKIIHIDMDAFYAAVEQRDNPDLQGKPVIVGGDPSSRGVVATCSYEARKFGIHSAMSAARAYRLCPQAVFVRPRFHAYREVSSQVRALFREYTDLVEPLSLDEAYLDVTENKKGIEYASRVAREILQEIFRRTALTASAGVSFNKFLAKVASDINKPAGLTVVTPEQAQAFIAELPIRRFHGVGRVTEKRMLARGITKGADLRACSLDDLQRWFGNSGKYFYEIAHGIDKRSVTPDRVRKSIGTETTLAEDCSDKCEIMLVLGKLAEKVETLLQAHQTSGLTLTLKIKYDDFQNVTRSLTSIEPIESAGMMLKLAEELLARTEAGERPVRLIGLTVSNLTTDIPFDADGQLDLPFSV